MDATARLLAPRKLARPQTEGRRTKELPGQQAPQQEKTNRKERRGQGKKQTTPPPAPAPMPKNGRKKRSGRGHSGRPPEVVLRTNGQKDSTEQPSLMKPYYLSDD